MINSRIPCVLTNHDLDEAVEANVVDVCVEEHVGEESPYLPTLVWIVCEDGARTFDEFVVYYSSQC